MIRCCCRALLRSRYVTLITLLFATGPIRHHDVTRPRVDAHIITRDSIVVTRYYAPMVVVCRWRAIMCVRGGAM